jgi:hypothetical protein
VTLLTIVRDACDRTGVARPTTVVSATDATARRLLALANEEGRQLARLNWPILRKEQTFTSTATEAQTNAIPADWGRFVDGTFWNRTAQRPLLGPLSPQEWQDLKAHAGSGVTDSFTYRGSDILILPTATAGQTMAFEYYSKNWCESSGGTDQSAWAADTDVGILNENLMAMGLAWRFQRASGLAWQESYAVYDAEVRMSLAQSQPSGVISMARRPRMGMPGVYVPDRDFPAP